MASQSVHSNQSDCLGACRQNTCKSCYLDSLINGLKSRLKLKEGKLELSSIDIVDRAVVEMINYCCEIICRKGLTSVVSIDSIYSHVQKLNSEIKFIVKNVKDLKDFLGKYPHMFNITVDKVCLKKSTEFHESRLKWIKIILQPDHPEVSKSVVNALQFYSDILFYNKKGSKFTFAQLVTHRTKASEEIQLIAKNPAELKPLLAAYPQIFVAHEDSVSLTDAAIYHKSDCKWLQDLISNDNPDSRQQVLFKRAVDHYLNILLKVEPSFQLSISNLFKLCHVAPMEIQELTKTKEDLMILLSNYPEVFTVTNNLVKINKLLLPLLKKDKNVSSRAKLNISEKMDPGSITQLNDKVCIEKVGDGPLLPENKLSRKKKGKVVTSETDSIAQDSCNQILKVIKNCCFIEVPLEFIIEEGPVKNMIEIKKILSNCQSVVIVDDKVIPKEMLPKGDQIVPYLLNKRKTDRLKYKEAIDYLQNFLLETVGVGVFCSVNEILKSIRMTSREVLKIISDIDLKTLLAFYPNKFLLKNDQVAFKDDIEKYKRSAFKFFLWLLRDKVGVGVEFPIARLKIYLEFASFHTGINTLSELKMFFHEYPAVFFVGYQTVTLKNNFKENYGSDDNQGGEKYVGYEKLYYFESYSTTAAIEYYSRVLKRFCFNLEVPVSYLFGYRSFTPIEVFALTKDPNELKNFLSAHPDIFCVREDKVSLSKSIVGKENEIQPFGSTENTAIQFYLSVLNKVNHSCESAIVTMFGYQHLAPPEVKDLIKTPLELKEFLCKYPHAFSVNNDLVSLVKPDDKSNETNCRDQDHEQCKGLNASSEHNSPCSTEFSLNQQSSSEQNVDASTSISLKPQLKNKQAVISAIRFYSNVMFKIGPNSVHGVAVLISYKGEAPDDVKRIAKNPTELLSFLSKFPQIFFVNNAKMTVMLSDMISFYKNQRSWIKELLPKYHQSTTNHESVVSGIQFYSNMIFEKSIGSFVSIKNLFTFRLSAMEDVQSLAKNHIELKNFLSMYPEIFTVCNDCVSLTDEAVLQKNQPKWIDQIVSDCDLSFLDSENTNDSVMKSVDGARSKKNKAKDKDAKTMKAVNFFQSILEENFKNINFTFSKLFEYRCLAPKEVQDLVETPLHLKDFCLKHPNVFTVKKDNVMLTNSKGKEKKKKNEKPQVNSVRVIEPQLVGKECGFQTANEPIEFAATSVNPKFSDTRDPKYIAMKTILFYSNIICKKGTHLEHDLGNLYSYHTKASNDIKEAIKNPKDLKIFLSQFPQLFRVNNSKNTVTIADLIMFQKNQRSWIIELLPQYHQSTTNHEAIVSTILFYSNIIFEKGSERGMPLDFLFSHRTGALDNVKAMAKNLVELRNFFAMFPDIFVLNNDGVSLSDQAILHKSQPKWIFELVCGNGIAVEGTQSNQPSYRICSDIVIPEDSTKQKTIAIRKTIQFYYRKMLLSNVSNKGFTLNQLLQEAPSDVKEITTDVISLKSFLSKYPHIFTLKDGLVYLTYFYER